MLVHCFPPLPGGIEKASPWDVSGRNDVQYKAKAQKVYINVVDSAKPPRIFGRFEEKEAYRSYENRKQSPMLLRSKAVESAVLSTTAFPPFKS